MPFQNCLGRQKPRQIDRQIDSVLFSTHFSFSTLYQQEMIRPSYLLLHLKAQQFSAMHGHIVRNTMPRKFSTPLRSFHSVVLTSSSIARFPKRHKRGCGDGRDLYQIQFGVTQHGQTFQKHTHTHTPFCHICEVVYIWMHERVDVGANAVTAAAN